MFNPIIVPVRNNLALTRKAIDTFRKQDIEGGVEILVVNNQSSDGTNEWLNINRDIVNMYFDPPLSVAESWNYALEHVFSIGAEYALVVNNDVELRPDTYRQLVKDGGLFVTAVGVRDPEKIKPIGITKKVLYVGDTIIAEGSPIFPEMIEGLNKDEVYDRIDPYYPPPNPESKRPHPDFSCFLIRKELYNRIGGFDENFKIAFCEDGDYDLRMWEAGVRAYCIDLPYLHHGSMTVKMGSPSEVRRIQMQAEKNRQYFKQKWGFAMGSQEYYSALDKGGPTEK